MKPAAVLAPLALLLASCGSADGPPLSVSDIVLYAPLPGQTRSAAYLNLQNGSDAPLVLQGISSPQFGRVEMHETVLVDGVSRMHRLESLTIAAGSGVRFAAGGKHLMLLQAAGDLAPGDQISLRIHYGDGGVVLLQAPLQARPVPGGHE